MTAPADIPRYRVLAPIFIRQYRHTDASSVPAGTEVLFEDEPGIDLMPRNVAAVTAKAHAMPSISVGAQNHRDMLRLAASVGFKGGSLAEASAFVAAWRASPDIPQ